MGLGNLTSGMGSNIQANPGGQRGPVPQQPQHTNPFMGQGSFLPLLRMLMMAQQQRPQQAQGNLARQQGIFGAGRYLPPYQSMYNMPQQMIPQTAMHQPPQMFRPYAPPAVPMPLPTPIVAGSGDGGSGSPGGDGSY